MFYQNSITRPSGHLCLSCVVMRQDILQKYLNLILSKNRSGEEAMLQLIRSLKRIFIASWLRFLPNQSKKRSPGHYRIFDTYIDDLSELIEKKRGIRDGALEELLSGKKRLEGFSGIWEEIPLRSVLREKIKIGPFGSQLKKETLVKSGKYKVYGQENIYKRNFLIGNRFLSQAHFDRLSTCEIKGGDFLMSTMGTIGKCAIAPMNLQRGIMDSHLIRFRLNESKLLPLYLLHLFSDNYTYLSNQTTKLAVGGIMDGLSVGIAKQLTVLDRKSVV